MDRMDVTISAHCAVCAPCLVRMIGLLGLGRLVIHNHDQGKEVDVARNMATVARMQATCRFLNRSVGSTELLCVWRTCQRVSICLLALLQGNASVFVGMQSSPA